MKNCCSHLHKADHYHVCTVFHPDILARGGGGGGGGQNGVCNKLGGLRVMRACEAQP